MSSGALLETRGVEKAFPLPTHFLEFKKRRLLALRGVDLSVFKGEAFCVVGESGCGKTTIGRAIMGLLSPTAGEVWFDGVRIDSMSETARRPYRRRMQMVFQNPYASLNPRLRVSETLAEPLRVLEPDLASAEVDARAEHALLSVGGDSEWLRRYPHEFSGGQRQRISIARALVTEPEFIVADEPISALDVSIQAQVLNLMMEAQAERGLTYFFITHDLSVVAHFATRVAVMYMGSVVELADGGALFEAPQHPYTQLLLAAAPKLSGAGLASGRAVGEPPDPTNPPSGCAFRTRCPLANSRCAAEAPQLRPTNGVEVACHAVEEGRSAA